MEITFKDLKPMTESPKKDGWYFVVRLSDYDDCFDITKIHYLVKHGWNCWRDINGEIHEEWRFIHVEEDEEAFWTETMEIDKE